MPVQHMTVIVYQLFYCMHRATVRKPWIGALPPSSLDLLKLLVDGIGLELEPLKLEADSLTLTKNHLVTRQLIFQIGWATVISLTYTMFSLTF